MSFVHLHLHTEYSLLDGFTRISDLVKKCKASGMPAVAITDHGNMYGLMKFYDACEKTKDAEGNWAVKPILGCEVYVAPRTRFERKFDASAAPNTEGLEDCQDPSGHRDAGYHLVLLAKNQKGFANLAKLVSRGFTEGFYYKPRIDKELLREHAEGLIALSACLGGEVQARLLNGQTEAAERVALEYREIFGEDFYLEIQDQGFEAERLIIPSQFELSERTGIPLVATNDAHYLNREDADLHDTLLCIGTKRLKSEKNRMRFSSDQFYVKTPEEMRAVFPDHPELLERTLEIAAKVELYPITRPPIPPQFPVPEGHTLDSYFEEVSREWFEKRLVECQPLWEKGLLKYTEEQYRKRLEFEIATILKMGYPGYFLLVWDFIARSREIGVPVGPGRGSAAGSIVAWSLKITDIDPMQFDLLFERFLNPERVSMPDVDIDFCRDGRQRVIDYVTEKYGKDRVCNIVTINQLKTKAVIKDVARVYEKDFNWSNEITKLVPTVPGQPMSVAQALQESEKLRERYNTEPDVKEILDVSARLEGLARNTGVHAAGVIISPDELTKFAPLSKDKDDKVMVQYTMTEAERAGLLKMDFLGLETLTQIAKTQGYIAQTQGAPLDMLTIRGFDDKKTYEMFSQGDTDGVFQFESGGMKGLLRKLQPDRFDDLIALNALFRPGPLGAGMGDTYVNRRHGREAVAYPFPELETCLAPSYGVILYQEQVMQIAQRVAGFSLGEADMLRRAMGKKDVEKMKKEKHRFVERGVCNGFDEKKTSELFDTIEYFAGYGFNKCVHGDTRITHARTGEETTVGQLHREPRPFEVHALGEDGRLRPRTVTRVMANGVKPVFELWTELGHRIKATGNHPFRTLDGWTLLEDLRSGDRIASPRRLAVDSHASWPQHELIALAWLLSEGNTCHPTCLYVFNNDEGICRDFMAAAEAFPDTQARLDRRADNRLEVCASTGRDTRFGSGDPEGPKRSGLFRWAEAIGILGRKAAEKSLPPRLMGLREADLEVFLGRLWSGDGFLANARLKVPFYATSSRELARGVQHLLMRLGMIARVHEKQFRYRGGTRPGYTVHLLGEGTVERFLERIGPQMVGRAAQLDLLRAYLATTQRGLTSKDTLPPAIRTWVDEARQAAGLTWKALEARSGVSMKTFLGRQAPAKKGYRRETLARLARFFASERLRQAAESDVYWDRVLSIEPRGEAETFDLTVEIDHNFVAEGLVVHNSHSAAYALVAYETAYLKANYRTEFMAGLLSTKSQRTDDVVKYIQNCREIGIDVLGPDINESELDFTITGPRQIRFGLAAIKGLGDAALQAILEARRAEGRFKDLFHALKSTDLGKANRKVWECLIKAGAFDSLEENRAALLAGLPSALESASATGAASHGMTSLFDEAEMESLSDNWSLPEDVDPWTRKERLHFEREALGLYVSGHPLEEYKDALQVHTMGSLAALREAAATGRAKDRDSVTLGLMVSSVQFKTNQKGEPWALLVLEDLTDRIEGLLMANRFDPATKQRTRTYDLYREFAMPDALLRVTGELRIETIANNGASEEGEEEEQTVLKLFIAGLEPLENFQGRGFTGAVVKLPTGEYPPRLLPILRLHEGRLPVTFEYRSKAGLLARVRAGAQLGVRFDPDLADKVAKEARCALTWTY